jgi:hypothetical protein
VRTWGGDAIGRWEGETLVVETINFNLAGVRAPDGDPASDNRIVERFTRTGPTELSYSFSVDNPALYSQTWRGEMVFRVTDKPMFEFACAEGNYAMENMLAGAGQPETKVAQAAP